MCPSMDAALKVNAKVYKGFSIRTIVLKRQYKCPG